MSKVIEISPQLQDLKIDYRVGVKVFLLTPYKEPASQTVEITRVLPQMGLAYFKLDEAEYTIDTSTDYCPGLGNIFPSKEHWEWTYERMQLWGRVQELTRGVKMADVRGSVTNDELRQVVSLLTGIRP